MKTITAIMLASALSGSNPLLPSLPTHFSWATWLSRIHAIKVLPALDYYFFAA